MTAVLLFLRMESSGGVSSSSSSIPPRPGRIICRRRIACTWSVVCHCSTLLRFLLACCTGDGNCVTISGVLKRGVGESRDVTGRMLWIRRLQSLCAEDPLDTYLILVLSCFCPQRRLDGVLLLLSCVADEQGLELTRVLAR